MSVLKLEKFRGQKPGTFVYKYGDFLYHKTPRNFNRFTCASATAYCKCRCVLKRSGKKINVNDKKHNHPPPDTLNRRKIIRELKATAANGRPHDIISNFYKK